MIQENVKIQNSLGKNISAVIHHPGMKTDKLAILCPGYLDTKDYASFITLANRLATYGYTVVRFDPTGTWDSEGDIAEYNNTQYLNDIKSVIEHMLSLQKYTHILLGGHSRGGMMSILYSARDPRITSVVAIMPSSGRTMTSKRIEDWKQNGFSISHRDIPDKKETKEFKVPYSHVEDREKYDVVGDVKNIHVPILFLAGELDDLVLPEDVKEIFNQANEPKKSIVIDGIGHDYRHDYSQIDKVNSAIFSNTINL